MATRGPFGRDLSDTFNYSDAVRKALYNTVIILAQPVSVATTKRLSGIFTLRPALHEQDSCARFLVAILQQYFWSCKYVSNILVQY